MAVTVDDREPRSVVRALGDLPDVGDVRVERLAAADVVVGDVGIERKTPRDYVSSVFASSGPDLYEQVERLTATYEHAYVLIEGTLPEMEATAVGPDPEAVRGSLASITARHAPVIPCSDRGRLVDVAVRLGRKHAEDPSTRRLPAGAVTTRSEPVAKRMYGCIEGVGPAIAARLHDAFPTVAALARAAPEELTRVDGVGETRARVIYESLHGDDEWPR